MKPAICIMKIILFLSLFSLPAVIMAETLLAEGMREIEEFRMRQLQAVQVDAEIMPFTTDGCSANQSKSWRTLAQISPGFADEFGQKPPWEDCCVAHDEQYWQGTGIDGYHHRLIADQALKACVVTTGDRMTQEFSGRYSVSEEQIRETFATISEWMFRAVRLGGQPCSLLPWRWGYGWSRCAFTAAHGAPAGVSDVKADEQIVFFNTAAWLDPDGAHWNIPVHAWIYEPADSEVRKGIFASLLKTNYGLAVKPASEDIFKQRVNLLIADNERGKTLVVRIAGQDIELPVSAENGHVYSLLQLPAALIDANSEAGQLRFFAVTSAQEKRHFEAEAQLVSRSGVSIISDIDDTVKITAVTDRRQLLENTFFKTFQAVPGMPELYRDLVARGARLHFVSSSPWQLYPPLREFLLEAEFPWASLNLKSVRFRDETLFNLFKKGTETKPAQIIPLLQRYPERKFILIGDSGEHDPEVYGDIARRFPGSIHRILIRRLDSEGRDNARYQDAFKAVPAHKWQLFDSPDQLSTNELIEPSQ